MLYECSLEDIQRFFKNPGWTDVKLRLAESVQNAQEELTSLAMSGVFDAGKIGRLGGAIEALRNVMLFETALVTEKQNRLAEAQDRKDEEDYDGSQ